MNIEDINKLAEYPMLKERVTELSARTVELAKALSRAIDHIADSCSDHPIISELDDVLLGKPSQRQSNTPEGT